MSQKGDSENDIWDYKPLEKKKKQCESSRESVLKRRCLSGKSFQKSKAAKSRDDKVETAKHEYCSTSDDVTGDGGSSSRWRRDEKHDNPSRSVLIEDPGQSHSGVSSEDFCPMCQMPFSILVVQTERWHVAECLETSRESCEGISKKIHPRSFTLKACGTIRHYSKMKYWFRIRCWRN